MITTAQNLVNMKKFPSMEHPFGTDEFGKTSYPDYLRHQTIIGDRV